MDTTIICVVDQNDSDFAFRVKAEDADRAIELSVRGLLAWYCAAHPEDWEDDEDFTREDLESFWDSGYADPARILLDRHGIWYEDVDIEYDTDGEPCNVDRMVNYDFA